MSALFAYVPHLYSLTKVDRILVYYRKTNLSHCKKDQTSRNEIEMPESQFTDKLKTQSDEEINWT